MLDLFHELAQASCHRFLLSVYAKASVIGANVDLAALHNVSPMVERIFGGKELAFLCRVALFGLCELLRLICNGMESDLAIWVTESLLKNCADAVLRRIRIDDEGLPDPRMSEHRLRCERLFEGLECFFFFVGPDDGGTFLWGSFEKVR